MDHIESKIKSIRSHTGAFAITKANLVAIYPMPSKGGTHAADALKRFIDEIGVPMRLKSDLATSFTGEHTEFTKLIRKYNISLTYGEAHRHNQLQQVDVAIQDLKQ